jgi:hypothetical protein
MADERQQAWFQATTVQLDSGLWGAVQTAADEAGLSTAEYLDATTRSAAKSHETPELERRAKLSRLAAAATRSDAVALRAESEQAVRRAGAVASRSADGLALREAGLGNIAYVQAL